MNKCDLLMHLQFAKFPRGAKKEFFNRIAEERTVVLNIGQLAMQPYIRNNPFRIFNHH